MVKHPNTVPHQESWPYRCVESRHLYRLRSTNGMVLSVLGKVVVPVVFRDLEKWQHLCIAPSYGGNVQKGFR